MAVSSQVARLGKYAHGALSLVFLTAVSGQSLFENLSSNLSTLTLNHFAGAFVAGLDAGLSTTHTPSSQTGGCRPTCSRFHRSGRTSRRTRRPCSSTTGTWSAHHKAPSLGVVPMLSSVAGRVHGSSSSYPCSSVTQSSTPLESTSRGELPRSDGPRSDRTRHHHAPVTSAPARSRHAPSRLSRAPLVRAVVRPRTASPSQVSESFLSKFPPSRQRVELRAR